MLCRNTRLPVILILFLLAGSSGNIPSKRDFLLMDTFVSIEVKDRLKKEAKDEAIGKAASRMKEVAARFDYFNENSELAKINKLGKGEETPVSGDMLRVLAASRELYGKTKGALDVTFRSPHASGITGWDLDMGRKTITIRADGVKIDLSAIAKGFIVDAGTEVLKEYGIKNAIINAGGDMYCLGNARIGIRDPGEKDRIIAAFEVRDKGVATSGTYERPGHIIDPNTGEALKRELKSVTVTAKDCLTADGLATALFVLDTEEALSVIEGIKGAECAIIDEKGVLHVSSGMPQITLTKNGL